MIEIFTSTTLSHSDFSTKAPLGISITRMGQLAQSGQFQFNAAFKNTKTQPLPVLYNNRIKNSTCDIIAFIHDDVWLDDFHVLTNIEQGISNYDIIGLAGNIRRTPKQPSWAFPSNIGTWDSPNNLSGAVANGASPFGCPSYFGSTPAACKLLDGLFLAVNRERLLKPNPTLFDPQFAFHFYDMDFCRTAEVNGLTLGTWPIAVTHVSGGNYADPEWSKAYQKYIDKWHD